jgi:hypothetical protein
MPSHLLVSQLHFARSEFVRALEGVSEEDAVRRFMPMNCIGWTPRQPRAPLLGSFCSETRCRPGSL